MMTYTTEQLMAIFQQKNTKPLINKDLHFIGFDTRKLIVPEKTLFFALKGEQQDGHTFLQKAYDLGVRHFVVEKIIDNLPSDAQFFLVENTLKALQNFALQHRRQFNLNVIGVTGSNGKTVVKEWLKHLLSVHLHTGVVASPKSYNSQIGVPLSVCGIEEQHKIGIFEAGISTTNEMLHLAPLIDCKVGIFTNIGAAHSDGFLSLEEKINEKLKLFENAEILIYCKDYGRIQQQIEKNPLFSPKKIIT